jgi:hypothetical protein
MNYIDIQLAVNDQDEFPKEYATYQKYLPKIGNRKTVEAQGYFFAVGKGKVAEYSPVIAGSNELTPTIIPPSGGMGKTQPSGDIEKALMKLKLANMNFNL